MTEINAAGHIKEIMIFDDPEYCEKNDDGCGKIDYIEGRCGLHQKNLDSDDLRDGVEIRYKKCDACKEVYQRIKQSIDTKTNIVINNPQDEDWTIVSDNAGAIE